MPLLVALFVVAILDRGNVAYAALTMNRDLGPNAQMFGFGVGIMFFIYAIFEIPSNLALSRWGARSVLTRIAARWGIATMPMALAVGPRSFYALRAPSSSRRASSRWRPSCWRACCWRRLGRQCHLRRREAGVILLFSLSAPGGREGWGEVEASSRRGGAPDTPTSS